MEALNSQSTASDNPADLITDNIDIWTSAIKTRSASGRGSSKKLELYGIKKLRELILELAVQGKLVPQDPNDEPASVLLKRIAAEKAQLVKENKIKKPKALPEISEDEKPFEAPSGWEWARLADLGLIASSSRVHKKDWQSTGIPFYRAREIVQLSKYGKVANELFISEELFSKHSKDGVVPEENDIMITGVGTIGTPYIVKSTDKFYFKDASVLIFKNLFGVSAEYLYQFFKSPFWLDAIHKESMGTTVHTLTISRANDALIQVVPLAEQHRIVAKIDELMALCDQLEQQTETSIDAHATLVETLLTTLTNSADAAELEQNWHRLADHFDTLFTTEHSIDQLKQTILQLAVMGKLVPQDPNDEPAAVLLEKIAAEKAQLVKEKKIKKQKPLPSVSEDEKPFALPEGWKWCKLAEFTIVGTGATPSRSNAAYWEPKEVNWVSSGETNGLFVAITKEMVSELAVKETNVTVYPIGTLIVAMYGQGKTRGQVTELKVKAGTNQACAAIQLVEPALWHRAYLKLFFQKAYEELRSHAAGGAQPNLNVGKISNTVVPIPPLNEQHRIVDKVDQLMTLCDQLKARLQQAQQTQLYLADALVEQAVG